MRRQADCQNPCAAALDRFSGGEFTNHAFRRLGFDILPKGAALNRQARLLRELGGPPYAPAQAGVPARVADLPSLPAVYCMRQPERGVVQPRDLPQAANAL